MKSLGHTSRRVVLGHTFNTLRRIITKISHHVLSKFMILLWAALIVILGRRLDTPAYTLPGQAPPATAPTSPQGFILLGPTPAPPPGFRSLRKHQGESCIASPRTIFEAMLLHCDGQFLPLSPPLCQLWGADGLLPSDSPASRTSGAQETFAE